MILSTVKTVIHLLDCYSQLTSTIKSSVEKTDNIRWNLLKFQPSYLKFDFHIQPSFVPSSIFNSLPEKGQCIYFFLFQELQKKKEKKKKRITTHQYIPTESPEFSTSVSPWYAAVS